MYVFAPVSESIVFRKMGKLYWKRLVSQESKTSEDNNIIIDACIALPVAQVIYMYKSTIRADIQQKEHVQVWHVRPAKIQISLRIRAV